MQINLKAHNLTDLTFFSKTTLTKYLATEIAKLSTPDSAGDSGFLESYEKHRASAWVFKADEKTAISEVWFMYEAKKGGRIGKNEALISQIISLISPLNIQLNFECRASFQFGKRQHVKSIIRLPQKTLELPDMPFDRIQGMHFVKLDGSEIKYDVFLEAQTRGVLVVCPHKGYHFLC